MKRISLIAMIMIFSGLLMILKSRLAISPISVAHSKTKAKAAPSAAKETPSLKISTPTTEAEYTADPLVTETTTTVELAIETTTTGFPALDPSIKVTNNEGYSYDPTGRRDPFLPFVDVNPARPEAKVKPRPLEEDIPADSLLSYDLGQFKLVGVLWHVSEPKAMVQTPTGKVYLIKNRTKIGRNSGFVATIREGEVVVVEPSPDGSNAQTVVMSLQK